MDKNPHSAKRFKKIRPDAPASAAEDTAFDNLVNATVNDIDTPNPAHPERIRMSIFERVTSVIEDVMDGPNFKTNIGERRAGDFDQEVRKRYAEKHKRNP